MIFAKACKLCLQSLWFCFRKVAIVWKISWLVHLGRCLFQGSLLIAHCLEYPLCSTILQLSVHVGVIAQSTTQYYDPKTTMNHFVISLIRYDIRPRSFDRT